MPKAQKVSKEQKAIELDAKNRQACVDEISASLKKYGYELGITGFTLVEGKK